jgi:hypothetical protein
MLIQGLKPHLATILKVLKDQNFQIFRTGLNIYRANDKPRLSVRVHEEGGTIAVIIDRDGWCNSTYKVYNTSIPGVFVQSAGVRSIWGWHEHYFDSFEAWTEALADALDMDNDFYIIQSELHHQEQTVETAQAALKILKDRMKDTEEERAVKRSKRVGPIRKSRGRPVALPKAGRKTVK